MEPPGNPTFWNQAAATRKFTHPLDPLRFTREVPANARILDYGCGQGRLCAELTDLGYTHVTGIDSSSEMIRLATERNPQVSFFVNDGAQLPCADSSLDAVLMFAVLTCIPSDEAQKNLLREFKRTLRPGGLLLISDYPLQTDERNRKRYEHFASELGMGAFRLPDGAVLRHHRREWLAELLAEFRVVETLEIDSMTMNGNPARVVQLWARKVG